MIKLKEIENRKYDGREPVSFEYTIKEIDGPHGETQELRVWFERVQHNKDSEISNPIYRVFTFIGNMVYERIFAMPKKEMPLEMVVATGLNQLKVSLLEEVSYKEMLSYTIADIVKDM